MTLSLYLHLSSSPCAELVITAASSFHCNSYIIKNGVNLDPKWSLIDILGISTNIESHIICPEVLLMLASEVKLNISEVKYNLPAISSNLCY